MSFRRKQKQRGGSKSIRKPSSTIRGGAINAGKHDAKLVRMAVGTLNQWAMDFKGNTERIIKSIKQAHDAGAVILALPELAVSGYSCQDHFLEREMFELSFTMLKEIAKKTDGIHILVSLGCPILHKEVRYNCNVFIYGGKIVLIRPKHNLADDGNYREARWFTAWTKTGLEVFNYMDVTCEIGIGLLNLDGIIVGAEVCEELWVPDNLGAHMYLAGADVLINGSGSHFELGKQENKRKKLLENATRACGGIYLYSNLKGCDGERLYFDGGSLIAMNGKVVGETPTFTLDDVQLHYHDFTMNDITTHRMRSNSYQLKASHQTIHEFPMAKDIVTTGTKRKLHERLTPTPTQMGIPSKKRGFTIDRPINDDKEFLLTYDEEIETVNADGSKYTKTETISVSQEETKYRKEMAEAIPIENVEEVVNAAACWLWDYLRRSGTTGYMLPLSGGADSAATACIVYRMCQIIAEHKIDKPDSVQAFIDENKSKSLNWNGAWTANDWCNYILNSVYLPTSFSGKTRKYAAEFAGQIGTGTSHEVVNIDAIFRSSIRQVTRINFAIIENDMKIKRGLIALRKRVETVEAESKEPKDKTVKAEATEPKDKTAEAKANIKLILDIYDLCNATNTLLGHDMIDTTYEPIQPAIIGDDAQSKENRLLLEKYNEQLKEHEAIVKKDDKIIERLLTEYGMFIDKLFNKVNAESLKKTYSKYFTKTPAQFPDTEVHEINTLLVTMGDIPDPYFKKDDSKPDVQPKPYLSQINVSQWDLAVQNVQARTRMVMTYTVSQLKGRALLNLGSSNADEVYVGYYSKYDASSADVNPIGSLPKTYIQRILIVFGATLDKIRAIVNSEPTAELTPGLAGIAQTDETDIGLLYKEMSELGRLMSNGYGPLDTCQKLKNDKGEVFHNKDDTYINDKVTLFNYRYRLNRHKAVILPPSVHLLSQTPDDNRYNLRPFLYPPFSNSWQPQNESKQSLEKTIMSGKTYVPPEFK
jgi:NAD+ synthetase